MKDPSQITNTNPLAFKAAEGADVELRNQTTRRTFLQAAGLGAAALAAHGAAYGAQQVVDKDGKPIQGFENIQKATAETSKGWKPISDRKIRVGIVGYGFCKFGAAFGFQDHPNVEVVAPGYATLREYSSKWQAAVFRPAAQMESWIAGDKVQVYSIEPDQ